MGRLQEILARNTESELIPSELYGTLIESVRASLVATQVVALRFGPEDILGSSIDVALNQKNVMAVDTIAEGAEFRKDNTAAVSFNLKPVKYGMDIQITKEMIEDSKFSMVEWNVKEAGYQMARKLDSLLWAQVEAASALTDSTGTTYGEVKASTNTVSGGAAVTLANISTAVKNLRSLDYNPDYLIVSPAVEDDIRNIDTFHEADKVGNREMFERGVIGKIMGLTVVASSQVTANYAYVVDSMHALCLAEKRPITVENYKQENMDLVGIAVSARWGVRYLRIGASALITSS